jgi:arylsulfatase A-like enzyme
MKCLVLVVSGLRPDYLGCYGSDWVDTPELDRLAAESVVFDHHHADQPDAEGACRAWRTGCYQFPGPGEGEPIVSPAPADLLDLLREGGVATYLVAADRHPLPAAFMGGWRKIKLVASGGQAGLETLVVTAQKAIGRLATMENALLWVDLPTVLPPWNVPEDFLEPYFRDEQDEPEEESITPLTEPIPGWLSAQEETNRLRLQHTYAAAVSYADAAIGQILQALAEVDPEYEWQVVVTSNHGQSFGEHGLVDVHRPWLHEERLHLPLLIRLPGQAEAGRHVAAPTQPVDLPPTLLDTLGLPSPIQHGQSLVPFCRGEPVTPRSYTCSGWRVGTAVEWSLRTPHWKVILPLSTDPSDPPRPVQLYVKPDDRWEVNNVVQHHLELAERLEQTLRAFVEATRQPGPLLMPRLPDEA